MELEGLLAVREQPTNQIDHEIRETAMTSVLDLRDVLQLIHNRLQNRTLA
jgi:hypothetical protein